MPWGAAIAAVGAIGGAAMQSNAAGDAADAQQAAADRSLAEQRRQFDTTRQDLMPWLNAGQDALALQQRFLGGDASAFSESPDYQFRLQQGQNQLEGSAAARGNLFGGGAAADLQNYGQGMASQELSNWWNRLSSVSNTGQTTGQSLGGFGSNYANAFGQSQMDAANARASSYAGSANAWGNAANQLGNLGGQYFAQRNQQQNTNIGPVVKQPLGSW